MGYDKMQRTPIKVGLARISTSDQNCDLQVNALKAYGCDQIIREEGVSGGIHPQDRIGFKKARKILRKGDTLCVWKVDRLGLSLKGIIDAIHDLGQSGIYFVSLTESFSTETATGRAMMQMIGVMAQLERELIRERTIEGLQAAKARGQKLGRPFSLNDNQIKDAHRAILNGDLHLGELAEKHNVSKLTLKRAMKRMKLCTNIPGSTPRRKACSTQ